MGYQLFKFDTKVGIFLEMPLFFPFFSLLNLKKH